MCHILNNPKSVNKRTDVEGLNPTYAGILSTLKQNTPNVNRYNANTGPIPTAYTQNRVDSGDARTNSLTNS